MLKTITIKNFRGIDHIEKLEFDRFNILVGDNGTSKTTLLEAINYCISPGYVMRRIKHTDFHNGCDEPIEIIACFEDTFEASIDYNSENVNFHAIGLELNVKKRERKAHKKLFSEPVTISHVVIPQISQASSGYKIEKEDGKSQFIHQRALSLSQTEISSLPVSFYYGKERDRQIHHGYNTAFSTVVEDLNWRFLRSLRKEDINNDEERADLRTSLNDLISEIAQRTKLMEYPVMVEFQNRTKFFEIDPIELTLIDLNAPYENAIFTSPKDFLSLPIRNLGSGYEMIISLIFLETLASLSNEKLVILIDEPELHLHPKLQEKLAEYLLELTDETKGHQVFVTTHSPVFFKHSVNQEGVKTLITKKIPGGPTISYNEIQVICGLFPWSPSWGEINFLAFEYPTIEFHDELYGYLQECTQNYKEQAMEKYISESRYAEKPRIWRREQNGKPIEEYSVSLPVFIRNKVHHPENSSMKNDIFTSDELKTSIEILINLIREQKQVTKE